jgi:hypothetical protein
MEATCYPHFVHQEVARIRLVSLFSDQDQRRPDADLIVPVDFNTMSVTGGVNEAQEITAFRQSIATDGSHASVSQLECSEYFEGRCGLFDHIIITRDMAEAQNATAIISDCWAMLDDQPLGDAEPAASKNLSDHCPILVNVEDRDRD